MKDKPTSYSVEEAEFFIKVVLLIRTLYGVKAAKEYFESRFNNFFDPEDFTLSEFLGMLNLPNTDD